jgi:hypothetical protein
MDMASLLSTRRVAADRERQVAVGRRFGDCCGAMTARSRLRVVVVAEDADRDERQEAPGLLVVLGPAGGPVGLLAPVVGLA